MVDRQVTAATAVTQTGNLDWKISDSYNLKFQTSDGARDIFAVSPAAGGDAVTAIADLFTLVATGSTAKLAISGSTNAIKIEARDKVDNSTLLAEIGIGGSGAVLLGSYADGQGIEFDDFYRTDGASLYNVPLTIAASSQDWDAFASRYGVVSLLQAITLARPVKSTWVADTDYAANVNITGPGDYATVSDFTKDVKVYVNGVLLLNSGTGGNNDVYPGTDGEAQWKFTFAIKQDDVITTEIYNPDTIGLV